MNGILSRHVLCVFTGILLSNAVNAAVVYDNFGAETAFDISAGQGVGSASNAEYGLSFTISESGYMSSITVAASSASGAGDVVFSLYDSDLNIPGAVLETFSLSNLPDYGSSFSPQTIAASGTTFLDASEVYWLIASQPNQPDTAVWHNSTVSGATLVVFRDSTYPSWSPQFHEEQWALRVETSEVPVPGAVWLFGSGLLGLIGIYRRKKTA